MPRPNSGENKLSMEELQKRFGALNTRRIQVETQLGEEQKRLTELRREAKEKFGTDEIEALTAKLEALEIENEKKRSEYQQHLVEIEANLKRIETDSTPEV